MDNTWNQLQELFDIAWDLNKLNETRNELSQKVTTYLPLIMQDYSYLKTLESKANSWIGIEKFFKENIDIQQFYKEAENECIHDQCFGIATIFIITIQKLLERIE